MSQIQKVIILNKPLKIFEFTPFQLVLMALSCFFALLCGNKIPGDWKIGNLPAGFLVGLLIVCAAIVFVKMTEIKPMLWWRNLLAYRLNLVASTWLPHPEEAPLYPDATIIDAPDRKKLAQEFFIAEDPERLAAQYDRKAN